MLAYLVVIVPTEWCTGDPGAPHDPRVMSHINAIEDITFYEENGAWGWLWVDYGKQYTDEADASVTELCFDVVWRGPGKDPRY